MAESEQVVRVRYAEYLEQLHEEIVSRVRGIAFDTTSRINPFGKFTPWDLDQLYIDPEMRDDEISAFPKLFDQYAEHVLNLDLLQLYMDSINQAVNVRVPGTSVRVIDAQVGARSAWLMDEFDSKIGPRISAGFRDLNSVMSSQFIIAKTIALRDHTRQLNDYSLQLTKQSIEIGNQVWSQMMVWHAKIPEAYSQVLATYNAARIDTEKHVFEMSAKACLWPFTVFGHLVSILSAMAGATTTNSSVAGESPGSTGGGRLGGVLGGAMSGAVAGSVVPGWGTLAGGIVGAIGGLFR